MAFLSARAPTGAMPNTITGLSDLLSKIPSPAPRPDTIVEHGWGEGIDPRTEIDPIERQPPDIGDRIRQDKDRYRWLPAGGPDVTRPT